MSRNKLMKLLTLLLVLFITGAFIAGCNGDDDGLDDDVGVGEEDVDLFEEETGVIGDETFTTYDLNEDAFIDENEFNTFLADNEFGFTEADATTFDQFDLDDDGQLDQNEFNLMVEG